jgi:4-amino-4-deoxy-L-arabinose transferase-like glycosyltransferase
LAPFLFFSFSEAKANYYMVIGMPALALLLADRIERLARAGTRRPAALCALSVAAAAAVAAILVYLGIGSARRGLWWLVLRRREELALALLGLAALTGLASALFAAARPRGAVLAMALAGLPLLVLAVVTAGHADRYGSSRALARYLEARHPGTRVLVYQDYERLSSLPFYLDRRIGIVDSRSNDLEFGMRQGPDGGPFVAGPQARALLDARESVLLVHRKRLGDFRRRFPHAGLAPAARIGNVVVYERDSAR